MPGFRCSARLPLLLALAALATPALAYKFPPITEEERALTQVASEPGLPDDSGVDRVLAENQALLVQAMLAAVKVKSRLVWAADRQLGRIYPDVANPWWFDKLLVLVELDGERIFLDPGDRGLAFGRLAPGNEGTPALVFDRKQPEVITLPTTPFDQNHRRATLDLALDEDGAVTGSGSLEVAVSGGGDGWRWRIDGPAEGLKAEETPSGVIVTGSNLPAVDPPEPAPGRGPAGAALCMGWGWELAGACLGGASGSPAPDPTRVSGVCGRGNVTSLWA